MSSGKLPVALSGALGLPGLALCCYKASVRLATLLGILLMLLRS